MSTLELRKRLIEKIQKTQDQRILEEAFRLLELETTEDIETYRLNEDQKKAIREARRQMKSGQFLTDEQANKEIDDWWDEITDEEKAAVDKGLEDIKAGRVSSHKEAKKFYEKWL